jgi:hypothetical protein
MKATIETQVCTTCGLEKPLSEYYFRNDRQTYRRKCKDCQSKFHKAYRLANPERMRANRNAWRNANPERTKATNETWRNANRKKIQATSKAYYKANREKNRARTAKRRAAKLQATPAWADLKKIEEIYLNCPPGYHIDHYFPLQSPIMCGLHIESNLRYLPAKENISKGNRVSLQEQLNG